MPKLATWMRVKDEPFFARAFAPFPELEICNGLHQPVSFDEVGGLLFTGGADIAPEFLQQPVADTSILDLDADAVRDRWEFAAVQEALARELPILAICKGLQVLNVALGGTLHLDIAGHNAPEFKDHDIQPLRSDRAATHRFEQVNSSHHQAIDRLADGCQVEAWCAADDVIEQMRLTNYPFALAVQYHPERGGEVYAPLFQDFVGHLRSRED
ncbi:MAG: gamma-glutamyl-gamma-aminobutyrate hydrolase family protein [Verrucomicrobiota bacterium]|nr:gamma-glutamyl-gamma-aminobutyrate hydrolase family protein [Verrucomicrobiota bacterium]